MSRPTVFISYSHKDEEEKNELLLHLGVLRGAGLIDLWSDDRLGAGADWEADINRAMSQAKVAILLVSANFLNSSFILNKEVPALLARRKEHGLTVFPVIAKSCAWKKVKWLSDMNVRPRDDQPVWRDGGRHADEHLTAIAYEVADLIPSETAEAGGDRPPEKAGATPASKLRLFIVTADGGRFETEAPPSVLLAHLQSDFLAAWAPPEGQGAYVRYRLGLGPGLPSLDATLSLAEAGITDGTTLYLIREAVSPTSPVGLIVEDKNGRRYVTTVQLNTPIGKLASAFMSNLGSGGEASIELLIGAAGGAQYRTLRGDATLYDERVGHGARLRITPDAPSASKGTRGEGIGGW